MSTSTHPVVVAGYDGSQAGLAAVELGISRVERNGGHLIVVHAHEIPADYIGVPYYQEMMDKSADRAGAVMDGLEEALPRLREIDYEPDVIAGSAADAICRVAKHRRADEIIIGTRGLGPLRAMLGSVALKVLHHATCPVTVIPGRMLVAGEVELRLAANYERSG